MNLFTYNVKLVFQQKLELFVFPVLVGFLTLAVCYSSKDKPVGTKMLFEVISPLILGLLVTDIHSKEIKWRTAEITFMKPISLDRTLYLRYFLILFYGVFVLSVTAVFLHSTNFFNIKSFLMSIPVIMFMTSLSMVISIILGQNIAAFSVFFLFFLEGSIGSKYLPLYLFLETFSPNYEYFWINRGVFVIISVGLYVLGYYLLKNPKRFVR